MKSQGLIWILSRVCRQVPNFKNEKVTVTKKTKFLSFSVKRQSICTPYIYMKTNNKYKNSVFTLLFSDPALLRELYCALEGICLPPDVPPRRARLAKASLSLLHAVDFTCAGTFRLFDLHPTGAVCCSHKHTRKRTVYGTIQRHLLRDRRQTGRVDRTSKHRQRKYGSSPTA